MPVSIVETYDLALSTWSGHTFACCTSLVTLWVHEGQTMMQWGRLGVCFAIIDLSSSSSLRRMIWPYRHHLDLHLDLCHWLTSMVVPWARRGETMMKWGRWCIYFTNWSSGVRTSLVSNDTAKTRNAEASTRLPKPEITYLDHCMTADAVCLITLTYFVICSNANLPHCNGDWD